MRGGVSCGVFSGASKVKQNLRRNIMSESCWKYPMANLCVIISDLFVKDVLGNIPDERITGSGKTAWNDYKVWLCYPCGSVAVDGLPLRWRIAIMFDLLGNYHWTNFSWAWNPKRLSYTWKTAFIECILQRRVI